MLDHEEAVQQLEGHCRRGEEVAGGDHFGRILQERQPALGRVASTPNAWQIPGDASFRNDEAELLKLSVDLGAPQSGISSSPLYKGTFRVGGRACVIPLP